MKVDAVEMEALKQEILKGNLNIQNVLQVMIDRLSFYYYYIITIFQTLIFICLKL